MVEIEIMRFHVDNLVSSLKANITRYYEVLYGLRRMSTFLFNETKCNQTDIDKWFESENFGICEAGFWQSKSALEKYRQGKLSNDAISYSCHPDLRYDKNACFSMYVHRNIGKYLVNIKSRLPDSAWIYYQDSNNTAFQHPFIDQSSAINPGFDWSTYHTWISVALKNNPTREIKWTTPSIDYAGKGLIISVSIPVYLGDTFQGLWSIDLPIKILYQDTYKKQIPEQQNFITDYQGNIITHPYIEVKVDKEKGSIFHGNISSLGGKFKTIDLEKLIFSKSGEIELFNKTGKKYNVIYKIIPEIKWIFYSMYPKNKLMEVIQKRMIQEEKNKAIGTLAGGIAHDFNNILTSIIGFTEIAMEDAINGLPDEESLKDIYNASMRAKELVQQILVFSRQSSGKIKPVNLSEIVVETLKLIRSSTPSTITIIPNIVSTSSVNGNRSQLQQVILNLCTNAVYSLTESGGIINIELKNIVLENNSDKDRSILPDGEYIEFTITDNGSGIDPSIIDSIFEPYYTTKKVGQGTGIGLALVKGIIDSFKGDIQVKSKPGKTIFTVILPIVDCRNINEMAQQDSISSGTGNILFVDDEPQIVKMGGRMLKSLGYQVTTLTDSFQALELFKKQPDLFDMIITDMTMPSMTGDILSEKIRKIRPDIPIILCTGYSPKINKENAKPIGINVLLYKPFTKAKLANIIKKEFLKR